VLEILAYLDGAIVADVSAMKKFTTHKLALRSHTIRSLTSDALDHVAGGSLVPVATGFIMRDTVIIRTGAVAAPSDLGR
jgi:hypothetical protein